MTTEAASRLTPKGRATRARIVEAASDLVFAHGVARTSVEDVQQAAGVSASQLYHYFGDKQTLIRSVIAHQADAVIEAQQPWLGQLDSIDGLMAWRDALVALQVSRSCAGGCAIGSIAAEVADDDPVARVDLAEGYERWEHHIRQGLRSMHARGELTADADPDRLALALLAALQGGLILTQTRRDPTPLAVALDVAIDHIRDCLRTGDTAVA